MTCISKCSKCHDKKQKQKKKCNEICCIPLKKSIRYTNKSIIQTNDLIDSGECKID